MLSDGQEYQVVLADCIEHMHAMPATSVDLAVFSPPFPSVFSYGSEAADIGNSENLAGDAKLHLSYFFRGLARVVKPGRAILLHCTDIPRMKRAGGQGLFDFRGLLARLGERAGLVYQYAWAIRKNPQAQAIRGKSWELKFQGIETDRAMSRGALPDYLLKFLVPGENKVPIISKGEVARNDWIKWAEHTWDDIRETDTLNVRAARSEDDTRHICPLQLGLIERCIRLFSNPGEIVFSPFAGIGSEGFVALGGPSPVTKRRLLEPRRFYGIELKKEYHQQALVNLQQAIRLREDASRTLFDSLSPIVEEDNP